jgi:hypothetical protein
MGLQLFKHVLVGQGNVSRLRLLRKLAKLMLPVLFLVPMACDFEDEVQKYQERKAECVRTWGGICGMP